MKRPRLIILMLAVVAMASAAAYLLLNFSSSYSVDGRSASFGNGDLTFLVLGRAGTGQGGEWEQAPNLTDTLILVDLNPRSGVLNLISIPRDLYGSWGGQTFKINEAFELNKMDALLSGTADMTGIGTSKYVVVDLNTVQQVVDALGGINIDLPAPVTDSVSGYTMSAGEHHLDGTSTVWLIRNRYASEGDFFREANQHLVIEAVIQDLRDMNLAQRTAFVIKVLPALAKDQTNMNLGDLLSYAPDLRNLKVNNVVLDFRTGLLASSSTPVGNGNMYILLPSAGINNYGDIRAYIQSNLQ
ncbi:MAG: LCP family protein [Patescibacteria group bacterium]|nr:LCP family protein [Patescibacteria group bacterium]